MLLLVCFTPLPIPNEDTLQCGFHEHIGGRIEKKECGEEHVCYILRESKGSAKCFLFLFYFACLSFFSFPETR